MRIVALLAVRNEERYLGRCLEHHFQQEIETCLVDNGSTDRTLDIAQSFLDRGVIRVEHLPFSGVFELEAQLRCKEKLAAEIKADWFIHCDADEIRQAPQPYVTLREGIEAVDRRGYNAIDFDEFVFIPTSDDESFEGRDYVEAMRYYYYFEPDSPDRYRINAWKSHPQLDLHSLAGHKAVFPGLKLSPEPFILRHYIALSRAHAIEKYAGRKFSPSEKAKSWHGDRASFRSDALRFPPRDRLKWLDPEGRFDKSERWKRHPLFSPAVPEALFSASDPAVAAYDLTSARRQRLAALKKFKNDHWEYIPTIHPVSKRDERPFWSVMIPTFNANKSYVAQALESVLVQNPGSVDMQIEVVDDGTTDFDLEATVNAIGAGRVAYHRNPKTLGLAANWNNCIQRARGLWVHILHQDDKVLPGFYRRLRGPCADPRVVAAFCRGAGIDESGAIQWVQQTEREREGILANFVLREAAVNRIVSPAIVIRRSLYEAIGGFHTGMPYCADWDLYKRAAVFGAVWYEPQCLAYWRQHTASTSAELKRAGNDFMDRRRSIELSKAYLPSNIEVASSNTALKTSLLWAADILRESLAQDNFSTALAQAREILHTLQQLTGAEANVVGQSHNVSEDSVLLHAQVDWLETQVRAWIRVAEALQAKHQQTQQ